MNGGGFDERERLVLRASLETLIPTDDLGPGADEARVLTYIEHLVVDIEPTLLLPYRANLARLDELAAMLHERGFAALSDRERQTLLADMEDGRLDDFVPDSATFFALLREHCWQGMFGDPRHGGNHGRVGWDLIGFPG